MENNDNNQEQPPQENEEEPEEIEEEPEDIKKLKSLWKKEMEGDIDFKGYMFPLARIKKIIKSDPEVNMLAAEVTFFFSKACEMFVSDLTTRAWLVARENNRVTLYKSDIATAIARTLPMDFLMDIVPEEVPETEPVYVDPMTMPHDEVMPPGMVVGTPVKTWPGARTGAPGEGENVAGGVGRY